MRCINKSFAFTSIFVALLQPLKSPVKATVVIVDDFKFGDHAVHQCGDPIATVTNTDKLNLYQPRDPDTNECQSDTGICVGDCVAVVIDAGGGLGTSQPLNVIIGAALPNPGDCSSQAEERNSPPGWDFSYTGMCGKGKSGDGYWQNCLVHDVCVWARCTDHDAIPGGVTFFTEGGSLDKYCGEAFDDGRTDWRKSNGWHIGCGADTGCPDPMTCSLGKCIYPRPEGDYCDDDDDCQGYCSFFRCRSGNEGDMCDKDSDCTNGYCELLKCYDGSEGDRCGKDSDCQNGLTCFGVVGSTARCERKKGEGAQCGHDNDCLGYCQMLRCWDGSKRDKCKHNSDCQSRKCRFRRCR